MAERVGMSPVMETASAERASHLAPQTGTAERRHPVQTFLYLVRCETSAEPQVVSPRANDVWIDWPSGLFLANTHPSDLSLFRCQGTHILLVGDT
ncbi:MAG: hypothetical protein V3T53_11200 [Phycisphaerales bacterium]